jgi:hypothetical protein
LPPLDYQRDFPLGPPEFVMVNLALGKSETWISDRTGHKSSQMIHRYKRASRTHAELDLGPLKPLHEATPELAGAAPAADLGLVPPPGSGGTVTIALDFIRQRALDLREGEWLRGSSWGATEPAFSPCLRTTCPSCS